MLKAILPLALFLLLCPLASSMAEVAPGSAAAYYEDALAHFGNDAFEESINQAKNALQQDQSHLPARILLGEALLATGHYAEAEEQLLLAQQRQADRSLVDLPLARAQLLQGKYQQLVERIEPWPHDPDTAYPLFLLRGRALLELGELDKAEWMFDEALQLQAEGVGALLGRAQVHLARSEWRLARERLTQAAGTAPDDPDVWYLLSRLEEAERRSDEAMGALSRALELDPTHRAARLRRAAMGIDLGRLDQAQEDVDIARELMPHEPMVAYLQAVIHGRSGRAEQARAALERALELIHSVDEASILEHEPSLLVAAAVTHLQGDGARAESYLNAYLDEHSRHGGVRKRLGGLLLEQGQPEKAAAVLRPALDREPDDPQLLALMGRVYLAQEDYQDAVEVFERAAAVVPGDERLLLYLARSRLGAGQPDAAAAVLERLVRRSSESSEVGLLLGNLHLKSGTPEQARELAQQILERDPDDLDALNLLGVANLLGGRTDEARSALERVRASDPENLSVQLNLARLDILEGKPAKAMEAVKRLLRAEPDHLDVLIAMAQLHQQQGDLEAAIRWREEIRKRHPRALGEQLELVDLYLHTGRPEQALEVAEQLESLFPYNLSVLSVVARSELASGRLEIARNTLRLMSTHASYDSGRLLETASLQLQAGDEKRAYWSLSKAVQGAPDSVTARFRLGSVELSLEKLEGARERAKRLIEDFPQRAEGYLLEGDLRLHDGDYGGAEQAYRRALELAPSSASVVRLYRARSGGGRLEAGLETLDGWLERHPVDARIDRLLASALARAGRLQEARARYERLLERSPEDSAMLNDLALIYLHQGEGRALELAQRAESLAPDDPRIADTLGWILVKQGRPEQGLPHLRDAQSRLSRHPEIRYHIAVALADLGRQPEAREALRELLGNEERFEGREEAERLLQQLKK